MISRSETIPDVMKQHRENQPRDERTSLFVDCITEGEEESDDFSLSSLFDLLDYHGVNLNHMDYTPPVVKCTNIQNEKNSEETGKNFMRISSCYFFHNGMNLFHKDSPRYGVKITSTKPEKYPECDYNSKRKRDSFVHLATAAELTEIFEEDLNPVTKQLKRLHDSMRRSETTRSIVILQRQAMGLKTNAPFTVTVKNRH